MFLLDIQLFLTIDFPKGLLRSNMSWGKELWVSGMTIVTKEIALQTLENPIICKTGSPCYFQFCEFRWYSLLSYCLRLGIQKYEHFNSAGAIILLVFDEYYIHMKLVYDTISTAHVGQRRQLKVLTQCPQILSTSTQCHGQSVLKMYFVYSEKHNLVFGCYTVIYSKYYYYNRLVIL